MEWILRPIFIGRFPFHAPGVLNFRSLFLAPPHAEVDSSPRDLWRP